MKKKFLIFMLALFVGLPCTLTMAACGEKESVDTSTMLQNSMLTLKRTYYQYTGSELEPEVVVKLNNAVVPASEYVVQYANNINAGVADVVVIANEDSDIISGSASTNFTINPKGVSLSTYNDLKDAVVNANYNIVNLRSDIVIPEGQTLTIAENKTLNCGDYSIINNGTIVNNGNIKVNANSKESFEKALNYATQITLTDNIEIESNGKLNIDAEVLAKDVNLEINLNGYSIIGYLRVCGKNYNANVKIRNYMDNGSIGTQTSDYGVIAIGNKANISLSNIEVLAKYAALSTNGLYEGGSVSATNCKFTAYSTELGNNSSLAAYLPAKYYYEFDNCTFTASSAYYAKSGNHTLTNCTFNGNQTTYETPAHYGSGGNATGSALIIDSSQGYKTPLIITIYNGSFNSDAGYGIEEYCSGNVEDYSTTETYGQITFTTEKESHKVWDSPVD